MIEGQKIFLRAIEPSDVDLIFAWENNQQNWLNSHTQRPFSRNSIEEYVFSAKDIYTDKQLRLMIVDKASLNTIGSVDLFECDFNHQRAGVGILIEKEEDRGKGFAKEALSLLCDYSRDVLNFKQLYADVIEHNEVSLQLFQRCGFSIIGVKKDWIRTPNGFVGEYSLQRILKNGKA
jgi:diamine N-acetyltransferase